MKFFLNMLIVVTSAVVALAQPQISYIIPDIGTTRFATYVEFVGPANRKANFGADGVYLNNPGDAVRVRVARPADTTLVKIGPCVVSWEGRLVSTHVFVDPKVAPNSDQYNLLDSRFKIPLVVEVNGAVSLADTFFIVRPFAFGDRRADVNRVLGETSLGRRSKRGAMIIDSAILAENSTYTVSLANTDQQTLGNQAYLPFTLLSVGRIIGSGGTQIDASAIGADGGPGGGGGGGGYANFSLGSNERGFRGGNGFTGGGPGGYNNSGVPFTPPNSKRKPGVGSGQDLPENNSNTNGSASLNGVVGGRSTSAFENAGGGTGHPFGESGDACADRNNCSPQGGYGGGSGVREGERGGAGGFGTTGSSETGRNNGGRIVGNRCLIPLAGGSGGASGNPGGSSVSSSGGGGGGAVSMHALLVGNLDVFARGASAESRDVRAGSGSGGGVIIGSRVDNVGVGGFGAQVNTRTSTGFLEGGVGRSRYDARVPVSPGYYVGPVQDSITASLRDVRLSGGANGSDLFIYVKPENGDWIIIDTVSGYGSSWRSDVRLPGSDTLYYVCVGQQIQLPQRQDFVYDPDVVLSQSAWSIIRLFGPPIIQAPTDRDFGLYTCKGARVFDTITVQNLGESPLIIQPPTWTGSAGFSVVSPSFPDTIITNTSKQYVIAYQAPNGVSGAQIGQLRLDNNDTIPASNPWYINFSVDVNLVDLEYVWRGIKGDTIDVGKICVGNPLVDQITVTNVGDNPVVLQSFRSSDPSLLTVSANLPFQVEAKLSRNLSMTIAARRLGPAVVPTLMYVNDCELPDTLWVRFEGVSPQAALVGNGQFGTIAVGSSRQISLEIRNDGTSDLDIRSIPPVAAPFTLINVVPAPPTILLPGEVITLTYEFSPQSAGTFNQSIVVESIAFEGSCADTVDIILTGIGANADVLARPSFLQFNAIGSCEADTMSVEVENTGGTQVTLIYPAFINGTDAADFTIVSQPLQDTVLNTGEIARYVIAFTPRVVPATVRAATLSIPTSISSLPVLEVGLSGTRTVVDLQGPRVVDLGLIPVGVPTAAVRSYTNNTGADVTVVRLTSTNTNEVSAAPQPLSFGIAASEDITFTVTPLAETTSEDTIYVAFDEPCADSFAVIVRWTSEAPEIGVQNFVEFGTVSNCQTARDTMTIANTSALPIEIIDVAVAGVDQALFRILNPGIATGVTLDPLDTIVLNIEFDPRGSTDGVKTAQVITRALINGTPTSFVTELSGTRRTTIPATPSNVLFGDIDVLTVSEQLATIVNIGSEPIRITRIAMANQPTTVYTVITPALPTTLQPNGRLDIRVQFAPVEAIVYTDSIIVEFDQPCADKLPIPVWGRGRLNLEVELIMPKVFVDPSNDNVVLDVKALIATGSQFDLDASAIVTLEYDSPVFVTKSVTPGTILRNEVVAGRTELEVSVPNFLLTTDTTTIFQIQGQGTIGPIDSTDLTAVQAVVTVEGSEPAIRNRKGFLILTLCEEGGQRLIQRAGGLSVTATPTPANEDVRIDVDVYERGNHTLQMIDVRGSVVYEETWNHVPGAQTKVVSISTANLGAGTYLIRVVTPTRERSTQALIVH